MCRAEGEAVNLKLLSTIKSIIFFKNVMQSETSVIATGIKHDT